MTRHETVRRAATTVAALGATLALAACGGGNAEPGTPAAPEQPDTTSATIRVVDGEPEGGVERVNIASGEVVRLRIESDSAGEVHVHGYELEQEVAPDSPAVFQFTADIEGLWDVELHPETVIARLEVSP